MDGGLGVAASVKVFLYVVTSWVLPEIASDWPLPNFWMAVASSCVSDSGSSRPSSTSEAKYPTSSL